MYLRQMRGHLLLPQWGCPPTTSGEGMTKNLMVQARLKNTSDSGHLPSNQREHVSVR